MKVNIHLAEVRQVVKYTTFKTEGAQAQADGSQSRYKTMNYYRRWLANQKRFRAEIKAKSRRAATLRFI